MKDTIACDLKVFEKQKRALHENQSLTILRAATRSTELTDGYAFYYAYSSETFVSMARWITNESRCCPFFTFELVLEPIEAGYTICLRLRGSLEIKEFLKTGFLKQGIEIHKKNAVV
jgi:hypothetical protein